MTRIASTLRLEFKLQLRQGFLQAGLFSGLIWLVVLLPMPPHLRSVAEPYVLIGDVAIIGFLFIGGAVFLEKQERTLTALISTPLRFWEYLAAKLIVLTSISLFVAIVVVTSSHGVAYRPLPLITGVVLATLLMLVVGFISCLPFASVTDWFLAASIPLAIMLVPPVIAFSGLWTHPVLYVVPTQGPMSLLGAALGQASMTRGQTLYAVGYPIASLVGLSWAAKAMFVRYVAERSGG